MADPPNYWDHVAHPELTCPICKWTGHQRDCGIEAFEQLYELHCPDCGKRLVNIPYPTMSETRQAAADGNQHAIAELPAMERRQELHDWMRTKQLKDASRLPDLPEGRIDVIWDFDDSNSGQWIVLRVSETELWREPAFWEGWERFPEIAALLERRYGKRLASITPTQAAELWLYGDKISAPDVIHEVNQKLKKSHEF